MKIRDYLIKNEGLKLKPYRCTAGKLTIGVGRNLEDNGIAEKEALYMLDNDIKGSISDLKIIFPNWILISPNRQMVLIDMRFQLGATRFRKFKVTIQAVKDENWVKAGRQIGNSLYAKQVPNRAKANIKLMVEG